jgi:hypothetical protein
MVGGSERPQAETTGAQMTDNHRPDPATPPVDPWPAGQWEPYEPPRPGSFRDPLAGLDPAYPPYPSYQQHTAYWGNPYAANPNPVLRPRTNSMASAAMICALVAIPGMFFCFVGAVLAPAAVIMGIVGLGQIRRRGETGDGQAWTGIILGGVLTLMCIALVALWVALISVS